MALVNSCSTKTIESSLVFEHYSQSGVSLNCSIIKTLAISILQSVLAITAHFLVK
jgi:hypothetical protein